MILLRHFEIFNICAAQLKECWVVEHEQRLESLHSNDYTHATIWIRKLEPTWQTEAAEIKVLKLLQIIGKWTYQKTTDHKRINHIQQPRQNSLI
jgi:hypothetical protein